MNTFDQSYGAPTFGQRVYRAGDDKLDDYWPRMSDSDVVACFGPFYAAHLAEIEENLRYGYAEFALFDEVET